MRGSEEENVGQRGYSLGLIFLAYCFSSYSFQLICLLQEALSDPQAGLGTPRLPHFSRHCLGTGVSPFLDCEPFKGRTLVVLITVCLLDT